MRALGGLVIVALFSSCASSRLERGALLKTSGPTETCAEVLHRGQQTASGEQVQLAFTTSIECQDTVTREYERTRVTQLSPWMMLPVGAGFFLATAGVLALISSESDGRISFTTVDAVGSVLGLGIGVLAGFIVSQVHFKAPAQRELVVDPISPMRASTRLATGSLVTGSSPKPWPLTGGSVLLPKEHVQEPMWLNGVRVELTSIVAP